MVRPTLLIFARSPAIGIGKTRLARDVGRVEAWRIYRAMSADLIRRLGRDPRWRTVVRLAGDPRNARAAWPGVRTEPQGGGSLSPRLERAFRAHAGAPVAVIGTDSPELTPAHVARALRASLAAGAALGPAEDGGFWLLALSAPRARRLRLAGVRWSTPYALADTAQALDVEPALLEVLADVDDGEALAALRARRRAVQGPVERDVRHGRAPARGSPESRPFRFPEA